MSSSQLGLLMLPIKIRLFDVANENWVFDVACENWALMLSSIPSMVMEAISIFEITLPFYFEEVQPQRLLSNLNIYKFEICFDHKKKLKKLKKKIFDALKPELQ